MENQQPAKRSRFTEGPPPREYQAITVQAPQLQQPRKLKIKKKVYPSVAQYPGFDFNWLIDQEKEAIERDTLAVLSMRGMGSNSSVEGDAAPQRDPLHILIEAENEDQANRAEQLVRALLNDPNKLPEPVPLNNQLALRQSVFGSTTVTNARVGAPREAAQVFKEIRVPEDVAGGVIGKAGETVKRLQQESGARIQIRKDGGGEGEGGGFRVIEIRAPTQDIADRAEELVMDVVRMRGKPAQELVAQSPPTATPPPQANFVEYYHIPNSRAGAVIGRQGLNIKSIQIKHGCKISIPSHLPECDTPHGFRTLMICADTREQVENVKQEIALIVDSKQGVYVGLAEEQGSTPVRIPDDKAGLIIGKQGSTIKSIQERLQVRIQIPNQPDSGTNYRTASVAGKSQEGVQLAIREIEAILNGELFTNGMATGMPQQQQQQQVYPIHHQQQQQQQQEDYSAQWIEYYRQLDLLPPEQREQAYAALREHQQQYHQ